MSKYVKELMMDQLKTELDGDKSVLILDLKGLDAITEYQFRRDLRKKSIKMRVLRNTLARRVFDDMGMGGLSRFLEGPSVAVWGGGGVAELAKEISETNGEFTVKMPADAATNITDFNTCRDTADTTTCSCFVGNEEAACSQFVASRCNPQNTATFQTGFEVVAPIMCE